VVNSPGGPETVPVGAERESVETTVKTVLVPLVGRTHRDRRLGRSNVPFSGAIVSIRRRDPSQGGEISSSDLGEGVPVPNTFDEISALATRMNAMLARIEAGHEAQRRFVRRACPTGRLRCRQPLSALRRHSRASRRRGLITLIAERSSASRAVRCRAR
jgi:hypothetical protein